MSLVATPRVAYSVRCTINTGFLCGYMGCLKQNNRVECRFRIRGVFEGTLSSNEEHCLDVLLGGVCEMLQDARAVVGTVSAVV